MSVFLETFDDFEFETSRLLRHTEGHAAGAYIPRYRLREYRQDANRIHDEAVHRFERRTKWGKIDEGDMYLDYVLVADRIIALLGEA